MRARKELLVALSQHSPGSRWWQLAEERRSGGAEERRSEGAKERTP